MGKKYESQEEYDFVLGQLQEQMAYADENTPDEHWESTRDELIAKFRADNQARETGMIPTAFGPIPAQAPAYQPPVQAEERMPTSEEMTQQLRRVSTGKQPVPLDETEIEKNARLSLENYTAEIAKENLDEIIPKLAVKHQELKKTGASPAEILQETDKFITQYVSDKTYADNKAASDAEMEPLLNTQIEKWYEENPEITDDQLASNAKTWIEQYKSEKAYDVIGPEAKLARAEERLIAQQKADGTYQAPPEMVIQDAPENALEGLTRGWGAARDEEDGVVRGSSTSEVIGAGTRGVASSLQTMAGSALGTFMAIPESVAGGLSEVEQGKADSRARAMSAIKDLQDFREDPAMFMAREKGAPLGWTEENMRSYAGRIRDRDIEKRLKELAKAVVISEGTLGASNENAMWLYDTQGDLQSVFGKELKSVDGTQTRHAGFNYEETLEKILNASPEYLAERYNLHGKKLDAASPEAYLSFAKAIEKARNSELLKPSDHEMNTGLPGIAESTLHSASSLAISAFGGPVIMAAHMYGANVADMIDQSGPFEDPDYRRAAGTALAITALTAPMEAFSVGKIKGGLNPGSAVKQMFGIMGTEFGTEFSQTLVEKAGNDWYEVSKNGGSFEDFQKVMWEKRDEYIQEALLAGVSGAILGFVGGGAARGKMVTNIKKATSEIRFHPQQKASFDKKLEQWQAGDISNEEMAAVAQNVVTMSDQIITEKGEVAAPGERASSEVREMGLDDGSRAISEAAFQATGATSDLTMSQQELDAELSAADPDYVPGSVTVDEFNRAMGEVSISANEDATMFEDQSVAEQDAFTRSVESQRFVNAAPTVEQQMMKKGAEDSDLTASEKEWLSQGEADAGTEQAVDSEQAQEADQDTDTGTDTDVQEAEAEAGQATDPQEEGTEGKTDDELVDSFIEEFGLEDVIPPAQTEDAPTIAPVVDEAADDATEIGDYTENADGEVIPMQVAAEGMMWSEKIAAKSETDPEFAAMDPDVQMRIVQDGSRHLVSDTPGLAHFLNQQAELQAALGTENVPAASGDIDLFKPVNETHGHTNGDNFIKTIAQRVYKDAESLGIHMSNTGGDEYRFLPGSADMTAEQFYDNMKILNEKTNSYAVNLPTAEVGPTRIPIGITFGVGPNFEAADNLLTEIKKQGKRNYLALQKTIDNDSDIEYVEGEDVSANYAKWGYDGLRNESAKTRASDSEAKSTASDGAQDGRTDGDKPADSKKAGTQESQVKAEADRKAELADKLAAGEITLAEFHKEMGKAPDTTPDTTPDTKPATVSDEEAALTEQLIKDYRYNRTLPPTVTSPGYALGEKIRNITAYPVTNKPLLQQTMDDLGLTHKIYTKGDTSSIVYIKDLAEVNAINEVSQINYLIDTHRGRASESGLTEGFIDWLEEFKAERNPQAIRDAMPKPPGNVLDFQGKNFSETKEWTLLKPDGTEETVYKVKAGEWVRKSQDGKTDRDVTRTKADMIALVQKEYDSTVDNEQEQDSVPDWVTDDTPVNTQEEIDAARAEYEEILGEISQTPAENLLAEEALELSREAEEIEYKLSLKRSVRELFGNDITLNKYLTGALNSKNGNADKKGMAEIIGTKKVNDLYGMADQMANRWNLNRTENEADYNGSVEWRLVDSMGQELFSVDDLFEIISSVTPTKAQNVRLREIKSRLGGIADELAEINNISDKQKAKEERAFNKKLDRLQELEDKFGFGKSNDSPFASDGLPFSGRTTQDEAHRRAVESGNLEEAQRLVNEAARNAGYTVGPVFHGTGTTINKFDPTYTGKGNDQLGSGFYFSTRESEAEGYMNTVTIRDPRTGLPIEKPGGTDNPNVVKAFLKMSNPIEVHGTNLTDTDIDLTQQQAFDIIMQAPTIMDPENSPLGDQVAEYWQTGPTAEMVMDLAVNYQGASLIALENDFFDGDSTAFRQALAGAVGYDGVHVQFNENDHYVAWFPEQIKSAEAATYNEDGSLIPLSERFDQGTDDIRFSGQQEQSPNRPVRITKAEAVSINKINENDNSIGNVVRFNGQFYYNTGADADGKYHHIEAYKTPEAKKLRGMKPGQVGTIMGASVNKTAMEYSRNLAEKLGINLPVVVTNSKNSNIRTSYGFNGAMLKIVDDNGNVLGYNVIVNEEIANNKKFMDEVLTHEFGHILFDEHFSKADAKTQMAIQDAYNEWKSKAYNQSTDPRDVAKSSMPYWIATDAIQTLNMSPMVKYTSAVDPYWATFEEWFANQIAIAADAKAEPKTPLEKFFAEIVKILDAIVGMFNSRAKADLVMQDYVKNIVDGIKASRQIVNNSENKAPSSAETLIDNMIVESKEVAKDISKAESDFNLARWSNGAAMVNESGHPILLFHGTPKTFTEFDLSNQNNWLLFGGGVYMTTSRADAETNYTNPASEYNIQKGVNRRSQGATLQVFTNIKNPVHIGDTKITPSAAGTFFDIVYNEEAIRAAAIKELEGRGYDFTESDHSYIVLDLMDQLKLEALIDGKATGTYFQLQETFEQVIKDLVNTGSVDALTSEIFPTLTPFHQGISAKDVYAGAIASRAKMYNYEGQKVSMSTILNETFARMGFDGLVIEAYQFLDGMPDVNPETLHVVSFEGGSAIKSADGNNGEYGLQQNNFYMSGQKADPATNPVTARTRAHDAMDRARADMKEVMSYNNVMRIAAHLEKMGKGIAEFAQEAVTDDDMRMLDGMTRARNSIVEDLAKKVKEIQSDSIEAGKRKGKVLKEEQFKRARERKQEMLNLSKENLLALVDDLDFPAGKKKQAKLYVAAQVKTGTWQEYARLTEKLEIAAVKAKRSDILKQLDRTIKRIPRNLMKEIQPQVESIVGSISAKGFGADNRAALEEMRELIATDEVQRADLDKLALKELDRLARWENTEAMGYTDLLVANARLKLLIEMNAAIKKTNGAQRAQAYYSTLEEVLAEINGQTRYDRKPTIQGATGMLPEIPGMLGRAAKDAAAKLTMTGVYNETVETTLLKVTGKDDSAFNRAIYGGIHQGTKQHLTNIDHFGVALKSKLEELDIDLEEFSLLAYDTVNGRRYEHKLMREKGIFHEVDGIGEMTPADMMYIYLASQNEEHITAMTQGWNKSTTKGSEKYYGGVVFAKNIDGSADAFGVEPMTLSRPDIEKINKKFEDLGDGKYKKFADWARLVLNTQVAPMLNQQSNNIMGRDIATVDNWVNLMRVKSFTQTYSTDKNGAALVNMSQSAKNIETDGRLKDRVNNNQTVVIQDGLRMLLDSFKFASQYNSFADAMRLARNVLGDVEVNMDNRRLKPEWQRIKQYLDDMDGVSHGQRSDLSGLNKTVNFIAGNMTTAALGGGLFVQAIQPASVASAYQYINPAYSIAALPQVLAASIPGQKNKVVQREMEELRYVLPEIYSRVNMGSVISSLGGRTGTIEHYDLLGRNPHNKGMMLQRGLMSFIKDRDSEAMAALWIAAKRQYGPLYLDEDKTVLNTKLVDAMDKAVRRTQPASATKDRTAMASDKKHNAVIRLLTPFTSVTDQQLQILKSEKSKFDHKRKKTAGDYLAFAGNIAWANLLMAMPITLIDLLRKWLWKGEEITPELVASTYGKYSFSMSIPFRMLEPYFTNRVYTVGKMAREAITGEESQVEIPWYVANPEFSDNLVTTFGMNVAKALGEIEKSGEEKPWNLKEGYQGKFLDGATDLASLGVAATIGVNPERLKRMYVDAEASLGRLKALGAKRAYDQYEQDVSEGRRPEGATPTGVDIDAELKGLKMKWEDLMPKDISTSYSYKRENIITGEMETLKTETFDSLVKKSSYRKVLEDVQSTIKENIDIDILNQIAQEKYGTEDTEIEYQDLNKMKKKKLLKSLLSSTALGQQKTTNEVQIMIMNIMNMKNENATLKQMLVNPELSDEDARF